MVVLSGVGWPNGPVDNERILALPGPFLMLSSEHWHVREAQNAGHKVLYRVVPPLAQRPAVLDWNANAYASMIQEQVRGLSITDLIWANELDLNYERGDDENDFENLDSRYRQIASFGRDLYYVLRSMYPNVRLHWPAFTPNKDHQAIDHSWIWKSVAELYDIVDFHAYDNLSNILIEHSLYDETFPNKLLALTEWHCLGNLEEEQRVLMFTKDIGLESYFFIYRWDNAPEWWYEEYDIEHNSERYEMFYVQTGEETTMVECPSSTQLKTFAMPISNTLGVPWEYTEKQFQQESGWRNCNSQGGILTSSSGAQGVCQIKPNFHPTVNTLDPWASLEYAIKLIRTYYDEFGTWKHAYASYHDGSSFVRGYTDRQGNVHEPWNGQRDTLSTAGAHYLDVILGEDWDKETDVPEEDYSFQFGFATLAAELGSDIVGQPISDEIYVGPDYSFQLTTTGKMEYYKVANKAYFFLAARK